MGNASFKSLTDARKPHPLSWEEQTQLCKELPDHLARMALLIEAANKVVGEGSRKSPALVILMKKAALA